MAAARFGLVSARPGGTEVDVRGRAGRVVGVEDDLRRPVLRELRAGDSGCDALAGDVGDRLVRQLRGVGSALADEVAAHPLADNALQLSEQVQPGLSVRVPVSGHQEIRGQLVHDLRLSDCAGMRERQIHGLADDPRILRLGGADQVLG